MTDSSNNGEKPDDNSAEDEELKNIIDWQIGRFQHIQTISVGLLGISLTLLAVLISVYSALGSPLPQAKVPPQSLSPWYIGDIAFPLIMLFSYLAAVLTGFTFIVMFLIAIWKFTDILMARPLIGTRIEDINYTEQVDINNETLEDLQRKLLFAGVRLPVSLILLFLSIELYSYTMIPSFTALYGLALILTVPQISSYMFDKIGLLPDKPEEERPNFAQELIHDHPNSRVASMDMLPYEKRPLKIANILLILLFLTFSVTTIWSLKP